MKVLFSIIGSLLFLSSCYSTYDEYDMLNHFLKEKNIRLENLSSEPYYFKNATLYFNENEFKNQGFNIKDESKYKIDTALISNKVVNEKSDCITKISKPLLSVNGNKSLIAIEKKWRSNMELIIYLLFKEKENWVVKTSIRAEMLSSH